MKIEMSFTDDSKRTLEFEEVKIDSAFIEEGPPRATVLVYYIDLAKSATTSTHPVVRFSEEEFSIGKAENLKLGSPEYYRKSAGGRIGVQDKEEARYSVDIRTFLSKSGQHELAKLPSVSGHVTYGTVGSWLFCTSLKPPSKWELAKLQKDFSAECASVISNPSEFARELGATFAIHSSPPDIEPSILENTVSHMRPPEMGEKVVWVYHGPVLYSNNTSEWIETFSPMHRSTAMSFQKRLRFAWQREYRFSVSIGGAPRHGEFFLPISDEIRQLAANH